MGKLIALAAVICGSFFIWSAIDGFSTMEVLEADTTVRRAPDGKPYYGPAF